MRASVFLTAAVVWVAAGAASGQWISVEEAKLIPSGAKPGEHAGGSVALDGDTAVVGIPFRDRDAWTFGSVRGLASQKGAQALYGVDELTRTLIYITPATGSVVSLGNTADQPAGMTFDPTGKVLYVGDESGVLWRVKLNGVVNGSWSSTSGLVGLAYESGSQTLYASTSDHLVTVAPDPTGPNATITVIGPFGFADVQGLEFDPWGTLYGTDCATDQLLSIDLTTGAATAVGPLGYERVEGLTFDPTSPLLLGFDTASDQLVAIDPATGAASPAAQVSGDLQSAGASHVFQRNGATWSEVGALTESAPSHNAAFGTAVSISGDTAVVGAPGLYLPPNAPKTGFSGAAYVFTRAGSQWVEQGRLAASDAELNAVFGAAVAVDGDTILVGSPYDDHVAGIDAGSVYVFERQGVAWTETAKLTSKTLSAGDWFGHSLDLDGSRCLIGAPRTAFGSLQYVGVGYTFVRNGSGWSQEARLAREKSEISYYGGDQMGRSAALSGDTAVLGVPFFEDPWVAITAAVGAAWVYTHTPAGWTKKDRIKGPKTSIELDQFGWSVAADGDRVVAGALRDPLGGRADLFTPQLDVWKKQLSLVASDAAQDDFLGYSVALSGDTLIAGAPLDDHAGGADAGSAYVFRLTPPPPTIYCTAGTSASGCVAALSSSGTPSASAPSGFTVSASSVEGSRTGMFVFGQGGKQAIPWGNGTSLQCAPSPLKTSGPLPPIGMLGACDGAFALDVNALWCPTCPKPSINPGEGSVVQVQLWYRDPLNTSGQMTSFSNAIEVWVLP